MSFTDIYDREWRICLPRQPRSVEWVEKLLHRLWDRGLDFQSFKVDGHFPQTWEEQLKATSIDDIGAESGETFRSYLGRVATGERLDLVGGSFWTCHEFGSPYLRFDLQKHPSLDWIVLTLDGRELEPYWRRKREQYETPTGYLTVYQAFLEWARTLCEIVEPLFGFGYRKGQLSSFDRYYEYVKRRGEVPTRDYLPDIDSWFSHPPLRYLAPTLLTPERQSELLSHTGWQIERLKTGGLFVTTPDPTYTCMAYQGYSLLHRADQQERRAEEEGDGALYESRQTDQELAEARRALALFTSINESNGVHEAEQSISYAEGSA